MKKIILFLLILSGLSLLTAQNPVPINSGAINNVNNGNPAYFYSGSINDTEQLNIPAYIWGQVRKPGLHIVPDNTDLLTLISLAGGPTEYAKLNKIRIVRQGIEGDRIIWVDVKKYLETGDKTLIPELKPGDTVIVAGTAFYAFYKMTDFLSKAVIVLSAYVTIKNL
ncbi:MAG: hypothetical protein CSB55_01330 [Candidatus Cloacimonadota bacterium]|nr:MAG: hypothetical protein CSB55_01330 [Candidatus Cloacimonadota bacterium]